MASNNPLPRAPIAPRTDHRTRYHGVERNDPYAWLKDPAYPTVEDPAVLAYLGAENAYFEQEMKPLSPLIETLFQELKDRRPPAEQSVPWREGKSWFYWEYLDGAQYRQWHWSSAAGMNAPEPNRYALLLDESELAAEQAYFRLGALALSPDESLLAYSSDINGSERYRLELIRIEDREPLCDPIPDTTGSVVFSRDGRYLFYRIVNAEWRPYRVIRRDLETGADAIVYEEQDGSFFVGLGSTQSEDYLVISSGDHVTSEVHLLHRDRPLDSLTLISARRTGHEYDVEHRGDDLLIRSNREHENFSLFSVPVKTPDETHWETLIAGSEDRYLTGLAVFREQTVLLERVRGLDQIRVWPLDGTPYAIEFPEASYAAGLGTNANYDLDRLRIGYESMVTPATVYDFDLKARTLTTLKVQEIPSGYDATGYETQRLELMARDGTVVPVSLVYRKDCPPSPERPLYLYGYGAYGIAIEPGFSANRLSLLDRGVTFAIAHIRGGDDMGYGWYRAGKLMQRTNSFNDFVDVAHRLIEGGLSGPQRIAMVGGSAGGELVGAAVNQAKGWLGAAVLHVPFVDVLNTMLDTSLPLTPMEWPEWGNPIEDPAAFHHILSYAPYEQLTVGAYPPMLVTGGLNDPRVTYWEPAKYVAKLRTLKTNDSPLLLKINMGAGHGGQSGRFDALREVAEEYAFVLNSLSSSGADEPRGG